ncbi:MAG: PBP1A family penicillin-binding protein [Rhizobiales bacterium]|nr:PBP1A family penicillin-binding protein [Hyphomicrobiales bacterium]
MPTGNGKRPLQRGQPRRTSGARIEPTFSTNPRRRTTRTAKAKSGPGRNSEKSTNPRRRTTRGDGGKKAAAQNRPLWRRMLFGGLYWGTVAAVWGGLLVAGIIIYYAASLPKISDLQVPQRAPNVVIIAMGGEILGTRGFGHGSDIRLEQLPAYLPLAVMAIEDQRFRSHFGIDLIGMARATLRNLQAGRVVEGGSTLTQQLAKNLFLDPERTFRRKIQEMILAVWLEANYSKDEILEIYLNRVYFGAGTYGVEAASRRYFGKSARHVTLTEAAILAGLLKAPSRYAPTRNPDLAEERAFLVLNNMVEAGFITSADGQIAVDQPPTLVRRTRASSGNYIADWVSDLMPGFVGSTDVDIIVETTIDLDLQAAAEIAVRNILDERSVEMNAGQAALVAIDTGGEVRALVGGRSYADSQFNRVIDARRQPGSAFKPFVYLAAMEAGLTPETIRRDEPVRYGNWSPGNYSGNFDGDMTLRAALSRSVNTIAVRLAREVGIRNVVSVAHRLGVSGELHNNLSLALGTAEVSLFELTAAFVPFANGGYGILPHVILRIRTASGDVLYERSGSGAGRVIEPNHVAMMNNMMSETIRSGTGRRAAISWPAAGKTGTSQESRDGWFVGYTADLVAGVWVGNDDATPTNRVTGGNLPATIWQLFMAAAHEGRPPIALPVYPPPMPPELPASTNIPVANISASDPTAMPVPRVSIQPSEPDSQPTLYQRIFGG